MSKDWLGKLGQSFFDKYSMNLKEFDEFKITDAIHFSDELNPAIFAGDKMKEDVRIQLLNIAEDFIDHLGIQDLSIDDITISGSSAAFSYTKHSDIDLHILVDFNQFKDDDVYRELFDAKKVVYNDKHDITIGGFPVELYVQDTNKPVISLGEYSVADDRWLKLPRKRRANFDQEGTRLKFDKLYRLADFALKSRNGDKIEQVLKTVKRYRQAGLDLHGEFGPENLAYKALRTKGIVAKLYDELQELHNNRLSLPESKALDKPTMTIDQLVKKHKVSKDQIMSQLLKGIPVELEHTSDDKIAREIALDHLGENPNYYSELAKAKIDECSGYIPSEEEKNDPRWERALSVDVHPDTLKKQAKKFGWKTTRAGIPPTLRP